MSRKLADLERGTREKCTELMSRCLARGINLVVVQTLRTWAEQASIYSMGRSRPGVPCHHRWPPFIRKLGSCKQHPLGAIVSNAPPGTSVHETGRAFDVAFRLPVGGISWEGPWREVGQVGEDLGLTWGGRWALVDLGHFEWRGQETDTTPEFPA